MTHSVQSTVRTRGLFRFFVLLTTAASLIGCGTGDSREHQIVLINAHVYSLAWSDPGPDGVPASDAPYDSGIWYPDAEAIYISGNRILYVGSNNGALAQAGSHAEVIDLDGAVVIPGAVESHGHVHELGEHHEQLNLENLSSKSEIVDLVEERAKHIPEGEWIIGWGWDEGAWANDLPDWKELNERIPNHAVVLKGRRGFGAWANEAAFHAAGFEESTANPSGGELMRDSQGRLTGVALNNAVDILYGAIPERTLEQKMRILSYGLNELASAGYVAVHHAGVRSDYFPAYQALDSTAALPLRVHLMLAAVPENRPLLEKRRLSGPTVDSEDFLQIRGVKAYYDGSLGSGGAQLLEDYADRPGSRGVSGSEYGFDETVVESMMLAGFQTGIHAIGDAGNRAVLDFYEAVFSRHPELAENRHRIEHAQVIHPDDFSRFSPMNIVASMEPAHAVEDSPWAEERLGPERIKGAYAWRALRENGAELILNSDYSGTDYSLFYGIYCAVTRSDRAGQPESGWYPDQRLTPEEALRGYTVWPARASGIEDLTGTISAGKWADLTVLSEDPLNVVLNGEEGLGIPVQDLLGGHVRLTIVGGTIVYREK